MPTVGVWRSDLTDNDTNTLAGLTEYGKQATIELSGAIFVKGRVPAVWGFGQQQLPLPFYEFRMFEQFEFTMTVPGCGEVTRSGVQQR